MQFDDRLATVLSSPTGGERFARTQFRQLLDLLGGRPAGPESLTVEGYRRLQARVALIPEDERTRRVAGPALAGHNPLMLAFLGWQRLDELCASIPEAERVGILLEPGQALRNRHLVEWLAGGDTRQAAAVLSRARLSEAEWMDLIPRLPLVARSLLRHRRDLPPAVRDLMARLGVGDIALPQPDGSAENDTPRPVLPDTAQGKTTRDTDIGALRRRIEAFREGKRPVSTEARLPLGDLVEDGKPSPVQDCFDFLANADARITWAEGEIAPLVTGMRIGPQSPGTLAVLDEHAAMLMAERRPLRGRHLDIDAASAVSGQWRIDAEPVFTPEGSHFSGWRGRIYRPTIAGEDPSGSLASAQTVSHARHDRMRQALHELKTPVNAIQGFAEVIQQQVFGQVPNAYRALAAAINVDAARLLAAFEELERMARLESGALALAEGDCDLREAVADTIRRLDGVLRPRNAALVPDLPDNCLPTQLAQSELRSLVWRVLATLGAALAPGEKLVVRLQADGPSALLLCPLPRALETLEDPFHAPRPEQAQAFSASMFGTGFALRLARAEAAAAGGRLEIDGDHLKFSLPLLTEAACDHNTA